MKFNFRKISAVGASALLTGMTMGVAAAANFPAPFVVGGSANVAIVYGSNAMPTDAVQAGNIQSTLQSFMGSSVDGGSDEVAGQSKSLASGSDLLYLKDELNENIQTLTKDDLSTILADGTFTDDQGTDYDFEQTVVIGDHESNNLAFSNSNNDLDDPAVILELSHTAANDIYKWTVTFNTAVNFTTSDSEGEELTIFGKTYTVGTATDSNTLVLLGGAESAIINVGESVTLTVDGTSYEVALNGLSSAATTQASVSVNGDTKTFTQGQTKTVGGVDVYVKTVFRTGDSGDGYAEIQLGANKLTLESGNSVQVGSDNDDIDGTLVTLTPDDATGVEQLTKIEIEIAAEDNDNNHLMPGEEFVDPVFGTIKVNFAGVINGPVIEGEQDTGRTELDISKGGNRELQLTITDDSGNTDTVPFTYNAELRDDNNKDIEIVEGATLVDDEYFILNSGNNHHMMQITKLKMATTAANSDVAMKDIITGQTYAFDNHNFNGYEATILGQTYTITNTSDTEITIVSSDFDTKRAVFPYIELVNGKDTRVAMTDYEAIGDSITGTAPIAEGKIYELPTGTIQFGVTNATNTTYGDMFVYKINEADSWSTATVDAVYTIGSVGYYIDITYTTNTSLVIANIGVGAAQNGSTDIAETDPGLLFVEEDDKSETTTTTKNAIIVATVDDSDYSTVSEPLFTGTSDTETFDDTNYVGWLTTFGTYVLRDSSDDHQNFVKLTYADDIMYAKVFIAEESATITAVTPSGTASLGNVIVTDGEVSSVSSKNLVIIGGSCINTAAATALGVPTSTCGSAFTDATGVGSGQFLIKGVDGAFGAGKLALVVAGYEAADTRNAAEFLQNQAVDTSSEYKGTTATSATMVTAQV